MHPGLYAVGPRPAVNNNNNANDNVSAFFVLSGTLASVGAAEQGCQWICQQSVSVTTPPAELGKKLRHLSHRIADVMVCVAANTIDVSVEWKTASSSFRRSPKSINAPVVRDAESAKTLAVADVERVFRSELTALCAQLRTFPFGLTY